MSGPWTVPELKTLLFKSGYRVPPDFAVRFVQLHDDEWELAEHDWTELIKKTLPSDAVTPRAGLPERIKQAVENFVAFVTSSPNLWCPECQRVEGREPGR